MKISYAVSIEMNNAQLQLNNFIADSHWIDAYEHYLRDAFSIFNLEVSCNGVKHPLALFSMLCVGSANTKQNLLIQNTHFYHRIYFDSGIHSYVSINWVANVRVCVFVYESSFSTSVWSTVAQASYLSSSVSAHFAIQT